MTARRDQGGWGSASAPQPVVQLLGPGAVWAGPYSLLGLRPGPVTDDTILAALDRRLAQIAASALRDSPEADETRLALHAAAAQLLDPSVRRHLEARWRQAQPPADMEREAAPAMVAAPPRSAAEIALEHDAVVTLGLYGGWNQRALRRLTMLAHARGLSSQAVAITLQRLASPRAASQLRAAGGLGPAPARRTIHEQLSAPDADEVDPAARIARRIALVAAALAGSVVASAILVAVLIDALGPGPEGSGETKAPPAQQAPIAEAPPPPRQRTATAPAPAAPEAPGADDAARALRTLAASETVTPSEAMRRFDTALSALEAGWPELTPSGRVAATDAVVEFVYRAAGWRDRDSARQAAERIAQPLAALSAGSPPAPDDVLPAVWSAGALSRLAQERDVPASAQTEIRRRLAEELGPRNATFERSFDAGAATAIGALADRLAGAAGDFWSSDGESAAAWAAWQAAVDGLAASNDELRERLILAGLESLLVHGPQPNQNEQVFDAVRALTRSLRWRPDGLARPALLRWFDDRRMTAEDLHAVTSTLARDSSAEGVDITMVAPIGASDAVRANHRAQYAAAWGLGAGVNREQAVAGWFEAADAILAERARSPSPAQRLARAVRLSRLSEAASWAWRGQIDAAVDRIESLDDNLAAREGGPTEWPQLTAGYTVTRSPWAESYLAAKRNIPLRSARLDELLRGRGPLHIVDAELVATEAMLGTPAEIRHKAGEVLVARANSATVTHAVLEAIARAPATRHASDLVSNLTAASLPEPESGAWRPAAMRALVERLLEQIAAEGAYGRIDEHGDELAASYAGRAADRPDAVAPASAADADGLAAALFTRWIPTGGRAAMATSAPVSLAEIESRTGARLKLARSTIERFCARQAGILELMALAVVIERPGDADVVAEILAAASQRRARASHILEQIEAVEEAMLMLWSQRLGRPRAEEAAPEAAQGANL